MTRTPLRLVETKNASCRNGVREGLKSSIERLYYIVYLVQLLTGQPSGLSLAGLS
jgi:hypothetical protein